MSKGIRKRIIILTIIIVIITLLGTVAASKAQDYMGTLDVYWRVHNEVLLPTEYGRHYIDLFFKYSDELYRLGLATPSLNEEGFGLIFVFEPWLEALVEGQGEDVIITAEMVTAVQTYLDHIYEKASPELRQSIYRERAQFPLENLVGLSMEEARRQLVGLPDNPTAVPTSFPASTE